MESRKGGEGAKEGLREEKREESDKLQNKKVDNIIFSGVRIDISRKVRGII